MIGTPPTRSSGRGTEEAAEPATSAAREGRDVDATGHATSDDATPPPDGENEAELDG